MPDYRRNTTGEKPCSRGESQSSPVIAESPYPASHAGGRGLESGRANALSRTAFLLRRLRTSRPARVAATRAACRRAPRLAGAAGVLTLDEGDDLS